MLPNKSQKKSILLNRKAVIDKKVNYIKLLSLLGTKKIQKNIGHAIFGIIACLLVTFLFLNVQELILNIWQMFIADLPKNHKESASGLTTATITILLTLVGILITALQNRYKKEDDEIFKLYDEFTLFLTSKISGQNEYSYKEILAFRNKIDAKIEVSGTLFVKHQWSNLRQNFIEIFSNPNLKLSSESENEICEFISAIRKQLGKSNSRKNQVIVNAILEQKNDCKSTYST